MSRLNNHVDLARQVELTLGSIEYMNLNVGSTI